MTHSDTALGPKLRMLIVAVLLGGIMAILDGTMIAVAVETLGREFQTGLATVGWVSTGYLLALVVTIPVTAWAVSRFGARRMWFVGLAVFLLASLACALAWNFPSLLIFRILQGVGAGIVDPLVLILLARAAGPARAGRVMGLMGVVLSSARSSARYWAAWFWTAPAGGPCSSSTSRSGPWPPCCRGD